MPDSKQKDDSAGETETAPLSILFPPLGVSGAYPPKSRFLSSGDFLVLLTSDGTGTASAGGVRLIRWSGDPIEDPQGLFLYVRDLETGGFRSIGRLPAGEGADEYESAWEPGVFRIRRRDRDLEIRMEACVPPESATEVRRIVIANRGRRARLLDLTSFAEVVLDQDASFLAHPVFSRLFVQTELLPGTVTLVAVRRPRAEGERHPVLYHALAGPGACTHETDRARFLGRGGSSRDPLALRSADPLAGSIGAVLDPSLSLRRTFRLEPGKEACFVSLLGAAPDRAGAAAAARRWARPDAAETALGAARRSARAELEQLSLGPEKAEALQALAGAVLFRHEGIRGEGESAKGAAEPTGEDREAPPPLPAETETGPGPEDRLGFFNGYGGFSADGTEYVIRLRPDGVGRLALPPLPWINVVANERLGAIVSETGAGCTWSGNSREHRLTPWSNDPVRDPHGEAFYVRDEESGRFWSLLPGPVPAETDYEVRHGFGYTKFGCEANGLGQEAVVFVDRTEPVKIVRARIENRSGRRRRLSLVSYRRLVLGTLPETCAPFVATELDGEAAVVFAESRLSGPFSSGVVFSAALAGDVAPPLRVSCDRASFLGPAGGVDRPAALARGGPIDGPVGAGLDPCIAEQLPVELGPGESAECAFLFGEAAGRDEARGIVERFRREGAIERSFGDVRAWWDDLRSDLRIETPVPAIDWMVNGWLLHQTISCRLDGRTALYQSGGAYGFRDQLQDASALVYIRPERTRAQILLHAAHQFVEGDVLHWWHPPDGRGIRTRFSDDFLWLAYIASFYVRTTGDRGVLDERVPFLEARALAEGEDEAFLQPRISDASADLYEHCCRAIDRSLATGRNGLPLFGTGDWNDGMNRVGRRGEGESVWMGFFLYAILGDFLPFCEGRGDDRRVREYRAARERLRGALNDAGWDGEWYRRGYYDDGSPLGSAESDECRIDALAQAWAVISGAAPADRAALALGAVERHLISEEEGLIRLLAPPFDRTAHDPGYIKGYVPGVRENGGQYTHAALWVVRAFAEIGRRDRAARLLEMLSPVSHGGTPESIATYRVEPYVIAADVYGAAPHVGRGGWTWYTGSAAWMYRVAVESVLGFRVEDGETIAIRPRIPDEWPGYRIRYRAPGHGTSFVITVTAKKRRAEAVVEATVDGAPASIEDGAARIPIARDGKAHDVRIALA